MNFSTLQPLDLPDEDHPSPPSIACPPSHIEAQIYLFEVAVTGDRDAEETGVEK